MLCIIDYGVGNLFSLQSSLSLLGASVVVSGDPDIINKSDRLILPGVGSFSDAINKLKETGLDTVIKNNAAAKKPILGICLGMQLLFDESTEYGLHKGLGLIPGRVTEMKGVVDDSLKIPHIGWNTLKFSKNKHPIFRYNNDGDFVYFVHSYYATDCKDNTIAVTDYSVPITAAVAKENVVGCQFHPEKSGTVGLNILRAFLEWEG